MSGWDVVGWIVLATLGLMLGWVLYEGLRAVWAERRQAMWDAHVEDAVTLTETPIYEHLAAEFALTIDGAWARFNGEAGR